MHIFNELFLVMEKLKLGKNMAALLVELNCYLTRIRSNCEYNSGIIRQSSFFSVTFLKKFNNVDRIWNEQAVHHRIFQEFAQPYEY